MGPDLLARENTRLIPIQERLSANLKRRYHKKLNWILRFQVPERRQHPTFPFFVWDNVKPPKFVIDVLKHGPTFAPPPPISGYKDLIPDLELLVKSLPDTQKEYYRWLATLRMKKTKEQPGVIELRNKLRRTSEWMQRNGIILTRADKSKTLVLMRRSTYRQGLREYINIIQCEKANENVVDKIQNKVKRFANSKLAKRLALGNIIVDSPDTPRLFAFAKTHKMGQQLRPIVDKIRAPTRKLEKAIHNLLSPHLKDYPYTIDNPVELIHLLRVVPSTPQYITVLDFKSMYPSVELPPAFCSLRDLLLNLTQEQALHHQVIDLAHLICYNSVFAFDGEVYKQQRGVPMGSPVSGDLCEMVVRQLERKILPLFLPNILLYRRYVDDILIMWKTIPDISNFVQTVNDNPYGLTLEMEQSSNTEVHFLDINIRSRRIRHRHVGSSDPFTYKAAAFNTLIKRAFSHSSTTQALNTELNYIKRIAAKHGYHGLAHRLIERLQRSQYAPTTRTRTNTDQDERTRLPVTFNPYVKAIYAEIAGKQQLQIAYRRGPTIYDILRNGKGSPVRGRLPGVYSIPLKDNRCNESLVYIGSTKRSLNTRVQEHQADLRHGGYTTALTTFASDPDIEPEFDKADIIDTTPHL
ncbi:uncharacterized protein [Centruroides vittatus]|uniref:uncharacterized protein n=1 Tax=Centruroides vittatus TaxID=120091 RepID=UPI00350FFD6F